MHGWTCVCMYVLYVCMQYRLVGICPCQHKRLWLKTLWPFGRRTSWCPSRRSPSHPRAAGWPGLSYNIHLLHFKSCLHTYSKYLFQHTYMYRYVYIVHAYFKITLEHVYLHMYTDMYSIFRCIHTYIHTYIHTSIPGRRAQVLRVLLYFSRSNGLPKRILSRRELFWIKGCWEQ